MKENKKVILAAYLVVYPDVHVDPVYVSLYPPLDDVPHHFRAHPLPPAHSHVTKNV